MFVPIFVTWKQWFYISGFVYQIDLAPSDSARRCLWQGMTKL
jgi:hypothetical protein